MQSPHAIDDFFKNGRLSKQYFGDGRRRRRQQFEMWIEFSHYSFGVSLRLVPSGQFISCRYKLDETRKLIELIATQIMHMRLVNFSSESYIDAVRKCVNLQTLIVDRSSLSNFGSDIAELKHLRHLGLNAIDDDDNCGACNILFSSDVYRGLSGIDFRENSDIDLSTLHSLKYVGIMTVRYQEYAQKYEQLFAANINTLADIRIHVVDEHQAYAVASLKRIFKNDISITHSRHSIAIETRHCCCDDAPRTYDSSFRVHANVIVFTPNCLDYIYENLSLLHTVYARGY